MDRARLLVEAVVLEGRSCRDVAAGYGVSKSWVAQLVARYKAGGYPAIEKRSRAPLKVANRTSAEMEDRILLLRKQLEGQGLDAGAHTLHYHLSLVLDQVPSVATLYRVLRRRGFVIPQPRSALAAPTPASRLSSPTRCGSRT